MVLCDTYYCRDRNIYLGLWRLVYWVDQIDVKSTKTSLDTAIFPMKSNNTNDVMQAALKHENDRMASEILDTQIKIVTAAYNQSVAYTNLILLAGYAGFFGIWQLTKEHLTQGQTLWSALLILVSLLFFVLFEIVKMILITKLTIRKAKLLKSSEVTSSPSSTLKALKEVESSFERSAGPFMVYWVVSIAISLTTALVAAAILVYAFISGLSIT